MALFYAFIFATWALGLLSWLVALSSYIDRQKNKREEHQLEIIQRKALFNRLGQMTGGGPFNLPTMPTKSPEIPDKIKELMKSSPTHPEVGEIEGTDEILGVRFEAENYPPGFESDDEE
jgi:hypothetical protein